MWWEQMHWTWSAMHWTWSAVLWFFTIELEVLCFGFSPQGSIIGSSIFNSTLIVDRREFLIKNKTFHSSDPINLSLCHGQSNQSRTRKTIPTIKQRLLTLPRAFRFRISMPSISIPIIEPPVPRHVIPSLSYFFIFIINHRASMMLGFVAKKK